MKIHDFVKSLRQSGEVDLDGSLLRSPGPVLGGVLAEHLAGLFSSDAEIAYGVQTSELATKSGGWQGTMDWYLIVGRQLLYLSVSIAPDPSGGSRATG